MLTVFEVIIRPGNDPEALLSEETKKETLAQIMTPEEAAAVGFKGFVPDPKGRQIRFIAVAQRDAHWIQRTLESHEGVDGYKTHDIG
ncbi:MAG: hypothetical protein IT379_12700 [Deltaproteobacteria bacterium]|nr:hypothetical protein [Deltaproteobacteria bacterium]